MIKDKNHSYKPCAAVTKIAAAAPNTMSPSGSNLSLSANASPLTCSLIVTSKIQKTKASRKLGANHANFRCENFEQFFSIITYEIVHL